MTGERLRRAREETLFELCPIPIALISFPRGRFLDVNAAFLRQLGLRPDEVVDKTTLDIGMLVDAETRGELVAKLASDRRFGGLRVWINDAQGNPRAVELYADRLTVDGEECTLVAGLDVSQAYVDSLTGLPNRTLLEERLERALARQREDGLLTAVLFIDIDDLKGVNDSLGHWAGDELIKGVAGRLRASLDEDDVVARIGGDEMVAVLRVGRPEEAVARAGRLRAEMAQPLMVGGAILRPGASIGIAVSTGEVADASASDLLRFADIALYRAKRSGGDDVALFDPRLDAVAISEGELGRELATAIDRCELEVHYQPIVRLGDLSVWGAEALARWIHPVHGAVPPTSFVPLAEMTGQIAGLGRHVLHTACRQTALWRFQGLVDPDFVISVNASAVQLQDVRFADDVEEVLRDTGLPAANLQIEVTERVAVERALAAEPLAALGVRLAIDDFGEGYGCLAYLRRLPIACIKVDRDAVHELPWRAVDVALMRSMLELAADLGHDLIAEGIETPEQLRSLRELGCRLGQGYLFGPALVADHLAEVVACRHPTLRLIHDTGRVTAATSTAASSSAALNGFDRNGVSRPSMPLALSTSSR